MAWNPAQYLKFAGPRLRPALDLLQRIDVEAPSSVYDIGAGAGNVTRLIAARWPEARVIGVDSSAEMLGKAAAENPQIEWQEADLAAWRPRQPADIIYSNAALHWLDGHDRLLPGLFAG
jgi:trans-aconitate 2-methyltransferase